MCADRQDPLGSDRFKFDGDGYYLKVARRDAPGLGRRRCRARPTLLIAERVQSADVPDRDRMPCFGARWA